MNKIKATKSEMRKNYRILSVGYCELQFLLAFRSPVAYSAGTYGWACDYYDIYGVIISTGCSPISSKNVAKIDYKTLRHYDDLANKETTREGIEKLLSEFIKIVKGE